MSETQTVTLTEFLLARIAEDEQAAREATMAPWDAYADGTVVGVGQNKVAQGVASWNQPFLNTFHPARVLLECEAKRRIVAVWDASRYTTPDGDIMGGNGPETHHEVLQHLAAVYADHPDYRGEWKP